MFVVTERALYLVLCALFFDFQSMWLSLAERSKHKALNTKYKKTKSDSK